MTKNQAPDSRRPRPSAPVDGDDAPELTAEILARAKPGKDVLPPEVLADFKRGRGRPKLDRPKVGTYILFAPDVLDFFKSGGAGWQTRLNAVLEDYVKARRG